MHSNAIKKILNFLYTSIRLFELNVEWPGINMPTKFIDIIKLKLNEHDQTLEFVKKLIKNLNNSITVLALTFDVLNDLVGNEFEELIFIYLTNNQNYNFLKRLAINIPSFQKICQLKN